MSNVGTLKSNQTTACLCIFMQKKLDIPFNGGLTYTIGIYWIQVSKSALYFITVNSFYWLLQ